MCLGGGSSPKTTEVYTPPEIEKYKYEVADIQIGDTAEIAKKKKQQQQQTKVNRNNDNLII